MAEATEQSHIIIAGYGIPGRAVADVLLREGLSFVVIERNAEVTQRCSQIGIPMLSGDVLSESVLREAGIERASLLVLAVPDDQTCIGAVKMARRLNPAVRIVARCVFTSAGLAAMAHGAEEAVIAEQVVARELADAVEKRLGDL